MAGSHKYRACDRYSNRIFPHKKRRNTINLLRRSVTCLHWWTHHRNPQLQNIRS